eukprot:2313317-Pleurochrysis_carterae.AAC.2
MGKQEQATEGRKKAITSGNSNSRQMGPRAAHMHSMAVKAQVHASSWTRRVRPSHRALREPASAHAEGSPEGRCRQAAGESGGGREKLAGVSGGCERAAEGRVGAAESPR